jgi:hypothetical protein
MEKPNLRGNNVNLLRAYASNNETDPSRRDRDGHPKGLRAGEVGMGALLVLIGTFAIFGIIQLVRMCVNSGLCGGCKRRMRAGNYE